LQIGGIFKLAKYSRLKPFSIEEEILFSSLALNFFSPIKGAEISKLLNIKQESGKTLPFSIFDFIQYLEKQGFESPFKFQQEIRKLITKLEKASILTEAGRKGGAPGLNNCYYFMKEVTSKESLGSLWLSQALGFELINFLMSPYIVPITGKNKLGDENIGTGTIISSRLLVTCAHVLTDMKVDEYITIRDKKIKINSIKSHKSIDVGLIYLDEDVNFLQDLTFAHPDRLLEILTIGYPKIPYSIKPEIIYQKGEVNGFIEDFYKCNYFLFSAIAIPGNSGGPIFSNRGKIIGLVTRDIPIRYLENEYDSDQENTVRKQIVPFFAGVPTSEIVKAVYDLDSELKLPVEDYE
jgi:S1-C subfamily serine protease